MDEILALNLVQRKDETLSPFESMHSLASPVSSIPIKKEKIKLLIDRKWLTCRSRFNEPSGQALIIWEKIDQ